MRRARPDLERSIAQTGSAALYGIRFEVNSATLRADSNPVDNATENGRALNRRVEIAPAR